MEGIEHPTTADYAWEAYTQNVASGHGFSLSQIIEAHSGRVFVTRDRDDLIPECQEIGYVFADTSAIGIIHAPTEYVKVADIFDNCIVKEYSLPDYVKVRQVKPRKHKRTKHPVKRFNISLWPPALEIERY